LPPNLQNAMQESINRNQAQVAEKIADAQLKIVTATFEKAAAYTNLMLIGGYAGFFGLWSMTKEFLSKHQVLWAALLVLISLTLFIVFEVVKMIVITKTITKKASLLRSPEARSSQAALLSHLNQVESDAETGSRRFMCFWLITVVLTASTALAGAGILVWAFVESLSISGFAR
jgi:hypothetical protein